MKETNKNLYYLNELPDYKVSDKDPDIRGWKIKDKDFRTVGKVDNLLVNKEKEKVVYIDVEVDRSVIDADHNPYSNSNHDGIHEFMNSDGENHLIIPIGMVTIDEEDSLVRTDSIDYRTFASTKRIGKGAPVEREYEVVVLKSYTPEEPDYEDDAFYDRSEFESTHYRNS